MFLEDLHLDGSDAGAITWGDDIPDSVKADAHVVVIGCGEAGLLAGIRLAQAGLPFTIVEKNGGPGGTWWDNRYPGARVDIGSHFYCYSFEPADHWTEYFSQQPELQEYFDRVMRKYGVDEHCRFNTEVTGATFDEGTGRWAVEVRNPRRRGRDARRVRGDQRGRFAEPTRTFPTSRAWTTSQGRRSTPPGGTRASTSAARASRSIGAGASGFQIAPTDRRRGRAPDRVPAHRAVDVPEPQLPRARARR